MAVSGAGNDAFVRARRAHPGPAADSYELAVPLTALVG